MKCECTLLLQRRHTNLSSELIIARWAIQDGHLWSKSLNKNMKKLYPWQVYIKKLSSWSIGKNTTTERYVFFRTFDCHHNVKYDKPKKDILDVNDANASIMILNLRSSFNRSRRYLYFRRHWHHSRQWCLYSSSYFTFRL